ncbi:MAG: protein prkA [Firmicutes bacterium]|nr:protein prkA [Bacillota bacterium]
MDLWQRLQSLQQSEEAMQWQGTFREYFQMVVEHPHWANLAHARVYEMIMAAGVEERADGTRRYRFFDDHLFGLERTIEQLVEFFRSAALRLEVRKRILLLMGPVGGGKSTLVTALKRGLERYARTEQGALFAIDGCPMHEEPLHLIPESLRPEVFERYHLYIEGDLCPRCRQRVETEFRGRIEEVPVRRIFFSERNRVGIGTFTPSDPKNQDIAELTGSLDLATIGEYGSESDPRAFRFDGELNIANRGLMEFIEMLKCDERFLYQLLWLSQEQNIKTGRYAMIYADEVIVSHSNEAEYRRFVDNRRNEALVDRMICIRVPYNLRVSDEERIYAKLIRESGVTGVHLAPHTLRVAATFAVLTRLKPSKRQGMSLLKKLKLYDGQPVEGVSPREVKDLQEECPEEGMDGISPRYVINRLSAALVRPGTACLTPLEALKALKDGLEQLSGLAASEKERLVALIYETRREYDDLVKADVQQALVDSFETAAQAMLEQYLNHLEAYVSGRPLEDPLTEEAHPPDERLMRGIEEAIGVSENAKRTFREEVWFRISTLSRRGERFDYRAHPGLKAAIEAKLFRDLQQVLTLAAAMRSPDPEARYKWHAVADRLVAQHGYCPSCAEAVLHYVGSLLSR